ncbi:sigma-70 family RNA polymerase sigma factor [Synechococcus sp. CS-205]|uniref:sigma-70 family RNA polymerase sigma factor n=1 Tax=Synechococcus sp. CS-205 TaxID=2847984 RepID=UPI00223A71DA|nr:sigma factor [Synechococcus sp. CS-205]MCT0249306.1 RNA polymerase subunit sigma-70 [Synechococcus sp. CS-205]
MTTDPPTHRPRPQQATARVVAPRGAPGKTPPSNRRGALRSPHADTDALVVEHLPFAAKVAANYARRTGHPREDLEQLAAIGLIKASRRYDNQRPGRSPNHFIAYARPYVNGEITHYLRDKGFLISVPGRWRELHARGQKLLREGTAAHEIPERLGITIDRWAEICQACAVRVVAMAVSADEELGG